MCKLKLEPTLLRALVFLERPLSKRVLDALTRLHPPPVSWARMAAESTPGLEPQISPTAAMPKQLAFVGPRLETSPLRRLFDPVSNYYEPICLTTEAPAVRELAQITANVSLVATVPTVSVPEHKLELAQSVITPEYKNTNVSVASFSTVPALIACLMLLLLVVYKAFKMTSKPTRRHHQPHAVAASSELPKQVSLALGPVLNANSNEARSTSHRTTVTQVMQMFTAIRSVIMDALAHYVLDGLVLVLPLAEFTFRAAHFIGTSRFILCTSVLVEDAIVPFVVLALLITTRAVVVLIRATGSYGYSQLVASLGQSQRTSHTGITTSTPSLLDLSTVDKKTEISSDKNVTKPVVDLIESLDVEESSTGEIRDDQQAVAGDSEVQVAKEPVSGVQVAEHVMNEQIIPQKCSITGLIPTVALFIATDIEEECHTDGMTDNEYPVVEGSEHSQVPCIMVHDIEKVTDDVVVEGTPVGDLKEQTAERVVVSEQTVPQKSSTTGLNPTVKPFVPTSNLPYFEVRGPSQIIPAAPGLSRSAIRAAKFREKMDRVNAEKEAGTSFSDNASMAEGSTSSAVTEEKPETNIETQGVVTRKGNGTIPIVKIEDLIITPDSVMPYFPSSRRGEARKQAWCVQKRLAIEKAKKEAALLAASITSSSA